MSSGRSSIDLPSIFLAIVFLVLVRAFRRTARGKSIGLTLNKPAWI